MSYFNAYHDRGDGDVLHNRSRTRPHLLRRPRIAVPEHRRV